ncbi:DegT/DnrJ/EryC1/StrS family aminotransferase [bacterium]|nr:DegT/DnrJ/EryC1/StrS family aminotransferase [bacterium]
MTSGPRPDSTEKLSDSTGFLPNVPLLAIDRQNGPLREQFRQVMDDVCDSGRFVLGPDVTALEDELSTILDVPHVIGCASGSDSLLLALMALNIKPGEEVILPSYTFFATASAVTRLGGVPIFADIDPSTFLIDPDDIRHRITSQTRAIIPVHLFGQTVDMDAILPIAKQAGLPIIEDAAQSVLSTWHGKCSGGLGDIGCFSFYPTKNLGGFGDGGFLTTTRDDLAESLRKLRVHGMEPRYYHDVVGINSRLDSLQAAVLRIKLPLLNDWTNQRAQNAIRYTEMFNHCGLHDVITSPKIDTRGRHVWNQYIIRVADGKRDALREHLTTSGVGTEIYYPVPLHLQKCFDNFGWKMGDLPITESAAKETLALPIFAELTPAEQATVVGRIAEFFGKPPVPEEFECIEKGSDTIGQPRHVQRTGLIGRADDVRC